MKKIKPCIIGLGYVGLPLFVSLKNKFQITGYDTNPDRVKELKKYIDRNKEFKQKNLKLKKGCLITSNSFDIKNSNFYIITVPTPIKKNNFPDLSYIKSAFLKIANYIKNNDIIILESTVYPGTTLETCKNIIKKKRKISAFLLAIAQRESTLETKFITLKISQKLFLLMQIKKLFPWLKMFIKMYLKKLCLQKRLMKIYFS